jgi:hypothetical protein
LSLPVLHWNGRALSRIFIVMGAVFIVMGAVPSGRGAAFGFTRCHVSRGPALGDDSRKKDKGGRTMMRISTLLTALAVTLAASALATPSFAQRSEGMSSSRVAAIHDCTTKAGKFKQSSGVTTRSTSTAPA